MKIAADLSLVGPAGENLGQYPVLKELNSPLLAQVTRDNLLDAKKAFPEIAHAIDAILETDYPNSATNLTAESPKKKK